MPLIDNTALQYTARSCTAKAGQAKRATLNSAKDACKNRDVTVSGIMAGHTISDGAYRDICCTITAMFEWQCTHVSMCLLQVLAVAPAKKDQLARILLVVTQGLEN